MINIIGSFVAFMGAMIFGWMGNLPMTNKAILDWNRRENYEID